jgi:hypothetical protein
MGGQREAGFKELKDSFRGLRDDQTRPELRPTLSLDPKDPSGYGRDRLGLNQVFVRMTPAPTQLGQW